MKKWICSAVSLLLICLVPIWAMAQSVPDNLPGVTLAVIESGDVMTTNYGTVTTNNGTITNNPGTVTENNGVISDCSGVVLSNGIEGMISLSGTGEVYTNYGTLKNADLFKYDGERFSAGNTTYYGCVMIDTDGTVLYATNTQGGQSIFINTIPRENDLMLGFAVEKSPSPVVLVTIEDGQSTAETAIFTSVDCPCIVRPIWLSEAVTVSNISVTGLVGSAIREAELTLTMEYLSFKSFSKDQDVTGLFPNIPEGITAKVKSAVPSGSNSVTVVFSGTPSESVFDSIQIELSKNVVIYNGKDFSITVDTDAKWCIGDTDPVITTPTEDEEITGYAGQVKEMSVTAQHAISYQWQKSTDGGVTWNDIAGATNSSYSTTPIQAEDSGCLYRCIVTGAAGTIPAISRTFRLTVRPIPETGDLFPWSAYSILLTFAAAGLVLILKKRIRL